MVDTPPPAPTPDPEMAELFAKGLWALRQMTGLVIKTDSGPNLPLLVVAQGDETGYKIGPPGWGITTIALVRTDP